MSNTTHKIPGLLSIVVPAYNEAAAIAGNVAAIARAAAEIADDYEIIVSDDGSTDGTQEAALAVARKDTRVKVVETRPNAGKGWALRKGALVAKGGYIGFLDADLDLHAEQFARLYEVMLRENADAVIGSKRHPESRVEYPRLRRAVSFAYYSLVRALFGLGLTDSQTGIKLFRREALLAVLPLLVVKRFAFDIELLVNLHRRGFKIAEAPVEMRFTRPLSRITAGEGVATIRDTLAVFYRLNALKFYDRIRPVPRELPPASVIIAGGSPNPRLLQCLEACAKIDYPDYEIILVLDAPPDGADRADIERIKSENGFSGAKRFEVRVSATRSPSVKRDEAASAGRGKILAFIDDDAFPPQDWLRAAAANFGDPAVAAVGGPNLCPEDHTPLERCGDAVLGSLLGGGTERRRYIPRPRGYVREFPTCNLTVRKEDFDAVGGFGCKFWPGEDTVLCEKITGQLGKKIAYDPDVIVYHHRRPLFRPHLAQIRRYALHRGYFVKRFPRTSRRPAFFLPSLWTLFIALGWIPGIFCAALLIPYAAVVGLYAVAAVFEGVLSVGLRWFWAVALGIALTHLTYGAFFIAGLLSPRLEEER